MIPFNLEKALAGEPVVMRNGTKVIEIAHLKHASKDQAVIAVAEDGGTTWHSIEGQANWNEDRASQFDLFMAPKEPATIWINVYHYNGAYYTGQTYKTCKDANDESCFKTNFVKRFCLQFIDNTRNNG